MKTLTIEEIYEKILGHLTKRGKKSIAIKIWFNTLQLLKIKYGIDNPSKMVFSAISNIKPNVILKKRKVGGTVYQIPYLIQNNKVDNSGLIAIRWFINAINKRAEIRLEDRLAKELIDANNNEGYSVKRKLDLYSIALQNRVYTKYLFTKSKK